MKILYICIISTVLLGILSLATQIVKKKIMAQKEKWGQFECGFNIITPSHIPFSFQFFLIALLFLIFDVEIALVLSYPIENNLIKSTSLIFLFLLVLFFGLVYEWQKGKIEWSKWMRRVSLQENRANGLNL